MQTIEQRLARLEQSVRRWKLAASVLLVAVLAFTAMGAKSGMLTSVPAVFQAHRIELLNDRGTVVASLGQIEGNGRLALYNRDGKVEFVATGTTDGGVLSICDGDHPLIRAAGSRGGGRIDLLSFNGQEAVLLNSAGGGSIGLFDARGNVRTSTGGTQNGVREAAVQDAEQRERQRAADGFPD
jgi:hypothetical protein